MVLVGFGGVLVLFWFCGFVLVWFFTCLGLFNYLKKTGCRGDELREFWCFGTLFPFVLLGGRFFALFPRLVFCVLHFYCLHVGLRADHDSNCVS